MVPWLPTVVTQPVMPSDCTLHFIRMSPDFSSFLAHSLTSTISPALSFLVVSFSLRVASLAPPPSSSKDSVKMVSFTTLKRLPPSSRNTVPWLPANVIQPSMSSFITLALTRRTSTVSSFVGPSKISTTSPSSSLRKVLPSLMLMSVVMTVSLDTFMNTRMRFMNFSLEMASSPSSSKLAKTLPRSSSVNSASSSSCSSALTSSLPSSSFASGLDFSCLGIFSHLLKKARNSDSSILPSLLLSMSLNMPSPLSLFTRLWFLMVSKARFSSAKSSSLSLILASSRKRVARLEARAKRGSKRAILSSRAFISPASQAVRSASQPSARAATSCLALAADSLASLMASLTSSASLIISVDTMVLPLLSSGLACSSALSTSSPAPFTSLEASSIRPCSSALSLASSFSLASLAAFLSPSLIFSRAMPTATFNRWNIGFLTPFSPSSTKTLNRASTAVFEMAKSNSPLAYFLISFRLRIPSLSPSYLSKVASAFSTFFRASAFLMDFSRASLQVASVASVPRVHSLMRCSSLARFVLASDGGWPGRSGAFISWPLERMKSVQAFILSLASWPASSTALAVALTSSSSSSLSPEKGAASSSSVLAASSAAATRPSNSLSSSSIRFSCSLICSTRCFACSMPCSTSCCMRSFWEPQASSSFVFTSSSSFWCSSKVSGVVMRTFWITLRMLRIARCSSCSLFTSSMRFCCSSMRFLLASSSFFLLSSSCRRCSSCCCTCWSLLISSNFLMFSSCCLFFSSSCCFIAMLYCCC
mmetsp:Transcript_117649/g.366518  ORF Transcript_117649/g.366518 Transcript_117649/m.366518 type:complete len:763 (+) Transcript_117649:253-2541(+)